MDMSLAVRAGVPLTAALLLLLAWSRSSPSAKTTAPPLADEVTCNADDRPPPPPPPPTDDVFALLDACLRRESVKQTRLVVTVAQVRRWVEVEHHQAWFDDNAWWLPLSSEGDAHYESGAYAVVPFDGSACRVAIVN